MLGKKFNIRQMEMNEDMREVILDEVRRVIENKVNTTEQTIELKVTLEDIFGGEWQVIIGEGDIAVYFNTLHVDHYIELSTESKVMLIFCKLNKKSPIPS